MIATAPPESLDHERVYRELRLTMDPAGLASRAARRVSASWREILGSLDRSGQHVVRSASA